MQNRKKRSGKNPGICFLEDVTACVCCFAECVHHLNAKEPFMPPQSLVGELGELGDVLETQTQRERYEKTMLTIGYQSLKDQAFWARKTETRKAS